MIEAGKRGRLLSALLLSALVHLLAGGGIPWPVGHPDNLPAPPIDARLITPPTPSQVARPRPDPHQPRPPVAQAAPTLTSQVRADVQPQAEPPSPPPPEPENVTATTPEPPALIPEPVHPESPPTAPAPLHPQLPGGFTVRYVVQGSEDGFVLGRLEHIWQRSAERYSLFAVAKATGLVSLIYPGLLSQTSYGQITAEGLKPENYWMHRGSRQLRAHFDWENLRADLGERYPALELKPSSQDLLSVIYQLALFPRTEGELWVLDGKTIKPYRLEALGRETVEVPLGVIRTRHLRVHASQGAERIDVWLRDAPPHLPIKIHMQGSRHGSAVLMAEAIRGLDPAADREAASTTGED